MTSQESKPDSMKSMSSTGTDANGVRKGAARFRVYWDIGIDCGVFSQRFKTEEEAEAFGGEWEHDMVTIDPENAEEYYYVVEEDVD